MPTLPACHQLFALPLAVLAVAISVPVHSQPIPVRHPQGSAHGFLVLKTIEGVPIATGDATQIIHGDRVTSRVSFHFRDGSVDSDHHIQRGPCFPKPIDVFIDAVTGNITLTLKTEQSEKITLIFRPTCRMVCHLTFY
jgi:hypothetical protein